MERFLHVGGSWGSSGKISRKILQASLCGLGVLHGRGWCGSSCYSGYRPLFSGIPHTSLQLFDFISGLLLWTIDWLLTQRLFLMDYILQTMDFLLMVMSCISLCSWSLHSACFFLFSFFFLSLLSLPSYFFAYHFPSHPFPTLNRIIGIHTWNTCLQTHWDGQCYAPPPHGALHFPIYPWSAIYISWSITHLGRLVQTDKLMIASSAEQPILNKKEKKFPPNSG